MMRRTILAVMTLMAFSAIAHSDSKSYLLHNGSEIVAMFDGAIMSMYYAKPKAGLKSAGIDHGTLLFRGQIKDGRIKGTAFAFRKGCPPAPYDVEGLTANGDIGFELAGAGPVFRPSCQVAGTSWKSPHSRLVFSYDSQYDDK